MLLFMHCIRFQFLSRLQTCDVKAGEEHLSSMRLYLGFDSVSGRVGTCTEVARDRLQYRVDHRDKSGSAYNNRQALHTAYLNEYDGPLRSFRIHLWERRCSNGSLVHLQQFPAYAYVKPTMQSVAKP